MKLSLAPLVFLSIALAMPLNGITSRPSESAVSTHAGSPRTSGVPSAPERHIPFRPRPNGTKWPEKPLPVPCGDGIPHHLPPLTLPLPEEGGGGGGFGHGPEGGFGGHHGGDFGGHHGGGFGGHHEGGFGGGHGGGFDDGPGVSGDGPEGE